MQLRLQYRQLREKAAYLAIQTYIASSQSTFGRKKIFPMLDIILYIRQVDRVLWSI